MSGQRQRYPGRFLLNVGRNYPMMVENAVLHMFSGSCDFGVSTDIRVETGADVVADYTDLPFNNDSFDAVLADPPYADHYQKQWGGNLPKPKWILKEGVRVLRPGGLIGILHIIVIPAYKELGVKRIGLHPILAGVNNAMRVFNVFKKL